MKESEDRQEGPPAILGPTPLERFVRLIPLPYPIAVLLIGALAGTPGWYVAQVLDHGTVVVPTEPYGILQAALFYVVPIYPFFAVRYVRRQILRAEPDLQALAPDGKESYRRAFRHLERAAPPLVLTVAMLAVTFVAIGIQPGPAEAVVGFLELLLGSFGYASVIWVYGSSLWGLYMLGRTPLRLKPYYEDTLLGARVMGSLSLSLVFAYFGGLFVAGLLFFTNAVFLSLITVLSFAGVALFFLPLVSIHRRMVEAQRLHRAEVAADFKKLLVDVEGRGSASEGATLADVGRILAHDILDRKASAISTWPFDTGVLSQFTVVIVSVIAILLSRIAQIALRL